MRRRILIAAAAVAAALAVAAAGLAVSRTAGGTRATAGLRVVAAEGVWGSVAAQLGGRYADVTSVISNPAADPHDYEPTAADARTLAEAQLVIVNGVGYDSWADKLLAANPVDGRLVLDVGHVVGVALGGNPHRWYSPRDVHRVVAAITRAYARLDPRHARYYRQARTTFERRRLATYHGLLAKIARRYRNVPVGASESIFAPLAQALRLRLLTPAAFLRAVSEGAEPTARDETTISRQIARRQIKVWIYNSQNSTPDVQRLTEAARARGLPVVTITETPTPASATFQAWQSRQLRALAAALATATGR